MPPFGIRPVLKSVSGKNDFMIHRLLPVFYSLDPSVLARLLKNYIPQLFASPGS